MRRGDIVKLKTSFQISPENLEEYTHGIIAARIKQPVNPSGEEEPDPLKKIKDLILYLYNPAQSKICLDEAGIPVLFEFALSEVELYEAVKATNWPDEPFDQPTPALL